MQSKTYTKQLRVNTDDCWLFALYKTSLGYGYAWNGQTRVLAHRFAYESWVGEIPKGLEIDHLCRVPACINPDHLEAVTRTENMRRMFPFRKKADRHRRTHCFRGHELTPENCYTYFKDKVTGRIGRQCKTCSQMKHRERYKLRLMKGRE